MTLACAAVVLAATGCGRERLQAPDPSLPFSTLVPEQRVYPAAGVRFDAPADWTFTAGSAPLVTTASNGTATIAVWRYARTEPLPRGPAALSAARDELERAAKVRDATFKLQSARRVRVDGAPAVQLVATQRVAGQERRVRSTHVYAKGAEFVIDAYTAPPVFDIVDRRIFRPLVASFRIDPPRP